MLANDTRRKARGRGKGHRSQVTGPGRAWGTRAGEGPCGACPEALASFRLVAGCPVLGGSVHLHLTFYFEIILFHGKVAK